MPESLVPEETRALIGTAISDPVTSTITLKEAQRFAYAVDDLNPLYFDESAAVAAGYRTILVPPIFLAWSLAPTRPLPQVRGQWT